MELKEHTQGADIFRAEKQTKQSENPVGWGRAAMPPS